MQTKIKKEHGYWISIYLLQATKYKQTEVYFMIFLKNDFMIFFWPNYSLWFFFFFFFFFRTLNTHSYPLETHQLTGLSLVPCLIASRSWLRESDAAGRSATSTFCNTEEASDKILKKTTLKYHSKGIRDVTAKTLKIMPRVVTIAYFLLEYVNCCWLWI